jgi:hypothetical protein
MIITTAIMTLIKIRLQAAVGLVNREVLVVAALEDGVEDEVQQLERHLVKLILKFLMLLLLLRNGVGAEAEAELGGNLELQRKRKIPARHQQRPLLRLR